MQTLSKEEASMFDPFEGAAKAEVSYTQTITNAFSTVCLLLEFIVVIEWY